MNHHLLFARTALLCVLSLTLTACIYGTSNKTLYNARPDSVTAIQTVKNTTTVSAGDPLAGKLSSLMDENDQAKLSKAMDGGLGKSVSWNNPINGATFTVTPLKKLQVAGSKFCRTYAVSMEKNHTIDEVQGTACIGEDGAWKTV